jgi:hypothetical protein
MGDPTGPILISLTIFTLAMSLIAYLRRRNLPEGKNSSYPSENLPGALKNHLRGSQELRRYSPSSDYQHYPGYFHHSLYYSETKTGREIHRILHPGTGW